MVPGLLSTVTPCLKANPLRGRTCASGALRAAQEQPGGDKGAIPGASTTGASRLARRSTPALCSVAYSGSGCRPLLIRPYGGRCFGEDAHGDKGRTDGRSPRQATVMKPNSTAARTA